MRIRPRNGSPVTSAGRRVAMVLTVVVLGVGAAGCATSQRPVVQASELPTEAARGIAEQGILHLVRPGQTLWRIAKAYGVPLDELAQVNRISDPTLLDVGQSLFIPRATVALDVPAYPAPPTGVQRTRLPHASPGVDFGWPVEQGRILSGYGVSRRTHRHQGLDIGGRPGQSVFAAQSGRVVYSGSTLRGYGKTVIIDHGSELQTLYAHNSTLLVQEGEWVERGQTIARVGRSGNASTEHCHFEIRRNEVPVDPLPYLSSGLEGTR